MTTKITIPDTVAGAKKFVTSQAAQANEAEWALAAAAYAWVEPADPLNNLKQREHRRPSSPVGKVTITEFAQWGAKGARNRVQVQRYRAAWQEAIDAKQAKPVEPGDQVELPDREFPDHPESAAGTMRSFTAAVKKNPTILTEAIQKGGEEMEDAVADALVAEPYVAMKVTQKVAARQAPSPPKAPGTDWSKVARAVVSAHGRADSEVDALARDLVGQPIYASQIEDVIRHLENDLTHLPKVIAAFRAMVDDAPVISGGNGRPLKDVTPVKELA